VSESPTATRTGRRLGVISVASIGAAVLTWLLQAVAGRVLGPQGYAAFMVVWGFVFVEVGLLLGLQQEVTRAVTQARTAATGRPGATPGTSPLLLGVLVGAACAVPLAATCPWWGDAVFGGSWVPVVGAAAFAMVAYATYNAVNGVVAGEARWSAYALAIAAEGVVRFVLVGAALLLGSHLVGPSWGLAGAGLSWLVLLLLGPVRASIGRRVPERLGVLVRNGAHAMVATGCSALMVSGFPVLLRIASPGRLPAEAGVVLAVVVATRAPLLLPLNAFSAVVLSHFVTTRDRVVRGLATIALPVLALTAVGCAAGWLLGPVLLRVLYGPAFVVEGSVVAALVLAAGLLTVQTLSGSAVLAVDAQRWYAVGWLVSVAVSFALLTVDTGVTERVVLSLVVGPVVGTAANVAALVLRAWRAQPAS
jgi:O-antigen/teichoic acid export membrane protein